MLARMWRNGNPLALLVGMQTGAAALDNGVEVPQKTKSQPTEWEKIFANDRQRISIQNP